RNRETRIRGNLGQPRAIGRDVYLEMWTRPRRDWGIGIDCPCSGAVRVERVDKGLDRWEGLDYAIETEGDVVFAGAVAIVDGICGRSGDLRRRPVRQAKGGREHPSAGAYQILSFQRVQVAGSAGGEPKEHGQQYHGKDRA